MDTSLSASLLLARKDNSNAQVVLLCWQHDSAAGTADNGCFAMSVTAECHAVPKTSVCLHSH